MWKQENVIHRSGQKINKTLVSTISSELNLLGHHGFETPQRQPKSTDPIKGLHIFTDSKLCTKCGMCFIKDKTFRNHHGVSHGGLYVFPKDAPIVNAQSLFMGGDKRVLTLFSINAAGRPGPSAPKPSASQNTNAVKLSPVELMRLRKERQLEHNGVVKDALAQRVVLPYLQNSGIAAFLNRFEANDLVNARILPKMTKKEAPPLLIRLRNIVLKSFIQTCRQVAQATEAGRYPFGRPDT